MRTLMALISRLFGGTTTPSRPTPSLAHLPAFTTLEVHHITGRGTVHIVRNPIDTPTLDPFLQTPVLLDGQLMVVLRAEGFAKDGCFLKGDRLGFLVRPWQPTTTAGSPARAVPSI